MSQKEFSGEIKCGHCSNIAPMPIVCFFNDIQEYFNEEQNFSWNAGYFWQILKCPACGGVIFRRGYSHDALDFPEYKILFPSQPDHIDGLPEKIQKAFDAAQKVKAIDSNAFAVLLGRVLDLICLDKNAQGTNLYSRLQYIASQGIIPQQLADMADALRQLRNIGAHADLGELTPAEIPVLETLIKAILEYVYSAPFLVQEVQKKINSLKAK